MFKKFLISSLLFISNNYLNSNHLNLKNATQVDLNFTISNHFLGSSPATVNGILKPNESIKNDISRLNNIILIKVFNDTLSKPISKNILFLVFPGDNELTLTSDLLKHETK